MDYAERSKRLTALQRELVAIIRWELLHNEEDVIGGQARLMRTVEISQQLGSILQEDCDEGPSIPSPNQH